MTTPPDESIHVATAEDLCNLFLPGGITCRTDPATGRLLGLTRHPAWPEWDGSTYSLTTPDGRFLRIRFGDPEPA